MLPTAVAPACMTTSSDVATIWEELQITPSLVERRGDSILVRGRVYARSRELGIRDVPSPGSGRCGTAASCAVRSFPIPSRR